MSYTNVKIDQGAAFDGDDIEQAGIGNYVILINKEDLDNGALAFDNISNDIETITLDDGAYGYQFCSVKGSAQIIPSSPLKAVSGIDGFEHTIDLRILDVTQLSIDNAKKLRFNKVVALVPLLEGGAIMYGRRVGLRMSDFQMNPGDSDTGGTFQVVLKTPDNDPPEIDPPHRIEDTFDITTLLQS